MLVKHESNSDDDVIHLHHVHHHHHYHYHISIPKPTYRIYCRSDNNYSLTIRDGHVIMVRTNPADPHQHWYKEQNNMILGSSEVVRDEEGLPGFALVNKASGQALKHFTGGANQPVQLTPYSPDCFDASIMWSESHDTGEGYKSIRVVNNISLNLDAFKGIPKCGGLRDGTIVGLWEWLNGDNQRWKIVPHCWRMILFALG